MPVVKRTPRSFSQGVRRADAPAANALGRRTSSDSGESSFRSSDGGGSLRAASAEPRTLQSLATPPLEKGAPKWVVGPDPRRRRSGQEEDPEREVFMEKIISPVSLCYVPVECKKNWVYIFWLEVFAL